MEQINQELEQYVGQHATIENVADQVRSFKAKFDDLLQDLQKLAVENEKTAQTLG